MTNTAAALDAPAVMPMMSGLASGLRASVWKIAPGEPERGADEQRRSAPAAGAASRTMNSASWLPWPKSAGDDVAQRDREVADADRHAERDERRPRRARSTTLTHASGPARAQPADGRRASSASAGRRRGSGRRRSPSQLRQLPAADQGDEERRADRAR